MGSAFGKAESTRPGLTAGRRPTSLDLPTRTLDDVVSEQFEFLAAHWPGCQAKDGCRSCVRYLKVRKLLLQGGFVSERDLL